MPFTCLIVMLIMFLVPLSIKAQSRFFVLAEITNAWSAMEVFVLSVVAALLEIQQFAAFIIGSKCDAINAIIAKIPEIDQVSFSEEQIDKLAGNATITVVIRLR